jgi:hypothetical protein
MRLDQFELPDDDTDLQQHDLDDDEGTPAPTDADADADAGEGLDASVAEAIQSMGQQLSATEHRFNAMSVETNQKLDLPLSLLPSSLLEQWSPAAATASGYGKRVGSRGIKSLFKVLRYY